MSKYKAELILDSVEGLSILQMIERTSNRDGKILLTERGLIKKILQTWPDLAEYESVKNLLARL